LHLVTVQPLLDSDQAYFFLLKDSSIMSIQLQALTPLIALIAGIAILVQPRLLNYIVAIYLILVGILGLAGRSGGLF